MSRTFTKITVSAMCALLAACAFITVNVYFPEKDVKQAYKSLDDMLLQQGGKSTPKEKTIPGGKQESPGEKPTSLLDFNRHFQVSLVREAYADEDIAKQLAEELSRMPEVKEAYSGIRSRIPQLHELFDAGAIGEGNNGRLVVLDRSKLGNNQALVDAVNNDRKTIITAMAKATLKITHQPENSQTMVKALTDSAQTFASVRQEKAKPGWFIQLPNGRWVQK